MNLRWSRILTWITLMIVSVGGAVAISVQMVRVVGEPYIGASEITGGVVFLVGSVCLAVWTVWAAPRMLTHQGVAADAIGVALIQEPNLWFPGRTVRIPWDMIRAASEDVVTTGSGDRRTKRKFVTLSLNLEYQKITAPSWTLVNREYPDASAVVRGPMTRVRIAPGNLWQSRVAGVIRAVRPDLFSER
ncbi:hypothetical protein EFW17_06980 [Halostreptopolyspora alba]|uniref:PH domain-containing protein n=1 Tax=Halostreptopolyspora alba TaxID=2487137 RepID=A0A3N0EDE5_9ACTN|nr:hypothetical protein EFW17_06980 [Nocardiopsaceae bacterium YIM 96095]